LYEKRGTKGETSFIMVWMITQGLCESEDDKNVEQPMKQAVSRSIHIMFLLGLIAACIGLCVNLVHPYRIPYVGSPFPPVVTDPDVPLPESVSVSEACTMQTGGDALFVDARRIRQFEKGHMPDAISLPWLAFDKYYHDRIKELVSRPVLIAYDQGMTDTKARELGRKLIEDGFVTVYQLEGGFEEWTKQGYPVENTP
jgi:rhodanese-related sulfurtransferase